MSRRRKSRWYAKTHNVTIWGEPLGTKRTTQPKPISKPKLQPVVKIQQQLKPIRIKTKPRPCSKPISIHKPKAKPRPSIRAPVIKSMPVHKSKAIKTPTYEHTNLMKKYEKLSRFKSPEKGIFYKYIDKPSLSLYATRPKKVNGMSSSTLLVKGKKMYYGNIPTSHIPQAFRDISKPETSKYWTKDEDERDVMVGLNTSPSLESSYEVGIHPKNRYQRGTGGEWLRIKQGTEYEFIKRNNTLKKITPFKRTNVKNLKIPNPYSPTIVTLQTGCDYYSLFDVLSIAEKRIIKPGMDVPFSYALVSETGVLKGVPAFIRADSDKEWTYFIPPHVPDEDFPD